MEKKIKFSLGLLILISLALIAELSYYQILKKRLAFEEKEKKEEIVTQPAASPTPKKLTNLEIAKKVLECLDKTIRDERGIYALGKECESTKSCRITIKDNRVGLAVMWARTKYIEKTGDQREKEILIKDIDLYLDGNRVKLIQPEFWERKLIIQAVRNEIFSSTEKEKVVKLAKKSYPGVSEMTVPLKKINNPEYQLPDFSEVSLVKMRSSKEKISLVDEFSFIRTVAVASDFLAWHLWQNDPESLKLANELLLTGIKIYFSLKEEISPMGKSTFGIVLLEFYEFNKEKALLNFSREIFNEIYSQSSSWFDESFVSTLRFDDGVSLAMFLNKLKEVTGDEKYRQLKEKLLEITIKNNFDFFGEKGFFTGDGCFFNPAIKNRERRVRENSFLVELLVE